MPAGFGQIYCPDPYPIVHFSEVFPVVTNPCGASGPSARRWEWVTCLDCLAVGERASAVARETRAALVQRHAEMRRAG